jgi:O-antigen ligase
MLSHNAYLQVLVEAGVVGLVAFLIIPFWLLRGLRPSVKGLHSADLERNLVVAMRATMWAILWIHFVLNTQFFEPVWIVMILISLKPIVFVNHSRASGEALVPAHT